MNNAPEGWAQLKPCQPAIDLTGQKFGKLLVLECAGALRKPHWKCLCDCGEIAIVLGYSLRHAITHSCGCIHREMMRSQKYSTKHGFSKGRDDPRKRKTYLAWLSIKARCLNPKHQAFKNYGGRGISLCDRWLNFENFLADMGLSPEKMQIDRINNNLGYFPTNCHWVTAKQNTNNRRTNRMIEVGGRVANLTIMAESLGLNAKNMQQALCKALKKGCSIFLWRGVVITIL